MTQVQVQVESHSLPTPKLKLSIKRKLVPVPDSQSSPKLRFKLSSALHAIQKAKEDNAEHDSDDDDEFPPIIFRVNKDETEQAIPPTSSGYIQKSSRSAHTDLVSKQNQPGDDEWLPGADTVTESVAPPLVKLGGFQSSNVARAKKAPKAMALPKKKVATSRSRLMKKLNF